MGGPCGICSGLRLRPGPGPGPGAVSAGIPPTSTRVAGATHWSRTQGDGFRAMKNGHPVTRYKFAVVATGCPMTSTRGCAGGVDAGAWCGHVTTAPT
jgi:hypothetical protein